MRVSSIVCCVDSAAVPANHRNTLVSLFNYSTNNQLALRIVIVAASPVVPAATHGAGSLFDMKIDQLT